jgi:hypothetical protein
MLPFPPSVRIYLAEAPCDMRNYAEPVVMRSGASWHVRTARIRALQTRTLRAPRVPASSA